MNAFAFPRDRVWRLLLGALQVLVLGMFVLLLWTNYRLRERVVSLRASLQRAQAELSPVPFRVGDRFDQVPLINMAGELILFDARRQTHEILLMVVNPECNACDSLVEEIAKLNGRPRFGVVVLSVGNQVATRAFAERHNALKFTFSLSDAAPPLVRLKLRPTPRVLLVTRSGRVARACSTLGQCL